MKISNLTKVKCAKCGWEWIPKKDVIYRCPRCQKLLDDHRGEIKNE